MAFTLNGIGTTFYGKRDFHRDGTYVTTEWIVFLYIPLIPIRSLRVKYLGPVPFRVLPGTSDSYAIRERTALNLRQVIYTYGYVVGMGVWSWLLSSFLSRIHTLFEVSLLITAWVIPLTMPWLLRHQASNSEASNALWDPHAAAYWSVILTPAFGSYLQMRNWQALGELQKAASARAWFYLSLGMLAMYALIAVLTHDLLHPGALFILLTFLCGWYLATGRKQGKYVRQKFGSAYPKKHFGLAVLGAAGAGYALIVTILSVGSGEFSANPTEVEQPPPASVPRPKPVIIDPDANHQEGVVGSPGAVLSAEQVFEKVKTSVVSIYALTPGGNAQGSGVVTSREEVVTNCHVVKAAAVIKVKQGEQVLSASLIHADEERDLCALSVPQMSAPAAAIGSTGGLRIGQRVYAIGAPRGLELTLSEGLISSLRPYGNSYVIQTSAPISPGSSGGGLFDEQGRLIGITTFEFEQGQNLNFAVPAEWISGLSERGAGSNAQEELATQYLYKAIALAKRKQWTALLRLARQWTVDQPENDTAWTFLGVAFRHKKQLGRAIDAYKEAVRIQPVNGIAWREMGAAYLLNGNPEAALDALNQSIQLQPEDAASWHLLAVAYMALGNREQAVRAYETLRQIDPAQAQEFYQSFLAR